MRLFAVTCAFLLMSSNTWAAEVLTAQGLGPVRIGMSLKQVQKALGKTLKYNKYDEDSDCAYAERPDKKASFMFFNYRLVRIDVEERGITSVEGARSRHDRGGSEKIVWKRSRNKRAPLWRAGRSLFKIPQKAKNRLLIFETWEGRVESLDWDFGSRAADRRLQLSPYQDMFSRTLKAMQMRSPSPSNAATECSSQLGNTSKSPSAGISEWRVIWVKS